jgi:DnaJ-like protein
MPRVPFDPSTDYYQLLGVWPGASTEEIQAAYRKLAKEYHPDLHAGSAIAAARMARVNAAKSVLLDAHTRASYDIARGTGWAKASRAAAGSESVRQWSANGGSAARSTASYEPATQPTVRYAPQQAGARPRHRVVSNRAARSAPRPTFDRQTGILFLVAVPLLAALAMYVFEAIQLSIQPPKVPPADLTLIPNGRPTAHGAAETVFVMVHAQPPSRDLATRANNVILQRSDSSPESELLRATGRQLLRSAGSGDIAGWDAAVADVCRLAGHC